MIIKSFLSALIGLACCAGPAGAESRAIFRGSEAYATQMHVHGLSNHNAHPYPASMQIHSAIHAQVGVDVLWWTDHNEMFRVDDTVCALNKGTIEPGTYHLVDLDHENGNAPDVTRLKASSTGGAIKAGRDRRGLGMSLRAGPSVEHWETFTYTPEGGAGKLEGLQWARPLISGPVLRVDLDFTASRDTMFRIFVDLSFHLRADHAVEQHQLIFQFVAADQPFKMERIDSAHVLVHIPVTPRQSLYSLDLLGPARLLRDGDDNVVTSLAFALSARKGRTARAFLKAFEVSSTRPVSLQLQAMKQLARRYEKRYGIVEYIGLEYSGSWSPGNLTWPHVNCYFPGGNLPGVQYTQPPAGEDSLQALIDRAHEKGGIVSLNHILGTTWEVIPDVQARQEYVREVIKALLQKQTDSFDLLEVGYLLRARGSLRDYLYLWDILTANGIYLTGTGTSDSHGGLEYSRQSPFLTWVWAPDKESHSLVEGLKLGRAFFGNPLIWSGKLAFRVGSARMGDKVGVSKDSMDLEVQFEPWSKNLHLYLVQGLIGQGYKVNYLHKRTPIHRDSPQVTLDTTVSSFVRLEAYRKEPGKTYDYREGEPVVFSNPCILLRKVPSLSN